MQGKPMMVETEYIEVITKSGRRVKGALPHNCSEGGDSGTTGGERAARIH